MLLLKINFVVYTFKCMAEFSLKPAVNLISAIAWMNSEFHNTSQFNCYGISKNNNLAVGTCSLR